MSATPLADALKACVARVKSIAPDVKVGATPKRDTATGRRYLDGELRAFAGDSYRWVYWVDSIDDVPPLEEYLTRVVHGRRKLFMDPT